MQTYVAPPDLTINLEPESFLLRKFRSIIRNIVAMGRRHLPTVQHWLGHSDMKSTMRYLKGSGSQHVWER
jgi:integrase